MYQLQSIVSTVRDLAFDIENIMNRENEILDDAINKNWLSTDAMKQAANDFLATAKRVEFLDM